MLDLDWGENSSDEVERVSADTEIHGESNIRVSENNGDRVHENSENHGVNEIDSEIHGERNLRISDSREFHGDSDEMVSENDARVSDAREIDTRVNELQGRARVSEFEGEEGESSNMFNDDAERLRNQRTRRPPSYLHDYVLLADEDIEDEAHIVQNMSTGDPLYFADAVKDAKWRQAMDIEISSIKKNNTWSLRELPTGAKKIGVKWVYKTKYNEHGEIDKHKARLVAKGYSQKHGIDYTEVFAPVARMDTVRMIIALAAQKGWKIFQLDVKSAFLYGELSEEVYIEQPRGYEIEGKEHLVYKLHKALYGLKQAPRAWFSRIEGHFIKEGFQKCDSEQTLFTKKNAAGKIIIVSIYVDDLIFTGDDKNMMCDFKNSMMREFDMTDLGSMRFFLGIEVLQQADGIFIYQRNYALEILKRFGMLESNEVSSPIIPGFKINKDENGTTIDETYFKQIVGSLMYLTATRPDMMFATSLISIFMSRPTELHLQAAK